MGKVHKRTVVLCHSCAWLTQPDRAAAVLPACVCTLPVLAWFCVVGLLSMLSHLASAHAHTGCAAAWSEDWGAWHSNFATTVPHNVCVS